MKGSGSSGAGGGEGGDGMIYLYGFVPEDVQAPPSTFEGVGGAPVRLVPMAGLAAAVSRLPREVYGEEALQDRLRDLDWVAEQGARHERVVTWFVDRTDILPVRLLSLYSSLDALGGETDADGERIRSELARLSGLREWDLKMSYDPRELEKHMSEVSEEVDALEREIEASSPGRRYLLEKKRSEVTRTGLASAARKLADTLLDEAAPLADEVEVLPIQGEGTNLTVVLNAALLVRREREDELRELVDQRAKELAARGAEVRFSGPWAPYRFVRGGSDSASTSSPADGQGSGEREAPDARG